MSSYLKITNYLDKCIENDMLSHAYIFYGPDESVKKEIALKFANKILSAQGGPASGWNPDLILILADGDEERSINLMRGLKKFLILSPYYGNYKIVIIEAAEKLNIYAQSVLLKIFEEAPSHAIIILNAKTIDSIPETIASRGVKLPFWRQNNIEIADEKITEIFNKIISGDLKDQYLMIEKFGDPATLIFKSWLYYLRTKFLTSPTQKLNNLLKTSQNIYFKLNETNINPKFAYDELILSLRNN